MSPSRLTECLAAVNWSALRLAKLTGWSEGAVRQWARGAVQIPADVAEWLEIVARFHERNPPPDRTLATRADDMGCDRP